MITLEEAREILAKEYHIDNFTYLVKDLLLPDFVGDKHAVEFNNGIFTSVTQLGDSSACSLSVFEVILADGAQNRRVAITQEMFKILRGLRVNNAVVAFVNVDKRNYRISLLTSKYEYDGEKIIKVLSNPRRYSYSLGIGTKTKTAYKFLIAKGKVADLDELINRFSVEVVNKQFYSEIATSFTELVGGERDGKTYEKLLNLYGTTEHNKYAEFGVRLIGRIMFCWFLREKRSENSIPLVPDDMLALETISGKTNYYHDVLEPLFFELLNTPHKKRKECFNTDYYKLIPYLNGGLFSPHTDDRYKFDSVNNCGQYGVVTIPNEWFTKLYQTLGQYNFTVDENTAYDIELSIDPEMLGRIFENLLAEINPETGENAKKSTGSFYTPRDIVDYMVDSSLCEYLKTKTSIDEIKLNALISYSKEDDDLAVFDKDEKKKLIDALYTVTVLDPACGSGAFPIGMLQKVVYVLQELDPGANLWFDKATENVGILLRKEFEKKFNAGSLNYIRKLSVIQNSIFGIDIQPIAVEISRLRCFLSLIIEEKVDDAEENRGINPLPNLDFKFIIANSLITLDNTTQLSIFENQDHIKALKNIREEYFNADSERRTELKLEFLQVQQDMLLNTIANYQKQASARYQQLSEWKPFENQATSWFDPEWMFGIKDGFDIVIGNPPYIDSEVMTKTLKDMRIKYNALYEVAKGNWDIFLLFIELAIKLLKTGGANTYILPNKLIAANYAKATRKYMSKYRIRSMRDYSTVAVFDASVYPIVYLLVKDNASAFCSFEKMVSLNTAMFKKDIHQDEIKGNDNWDTLLAQDSLATTIVKKMNLNKTLNEIATVKGSATVNEAYELKDIIEENQYNEAYFKFINTGTIDRFYSLWETERTQYIKTGYYRPVVKKALLKNLQFNRFLDALKEKIIIGGMCKYPECFYDSGEYLAGKSTTEIIDSELSLLYIVGVLNSKIMSFYYKNCFKSLSLAGGFFRFGPPQIKLLPIPSRNDSYVAIEKIANLSAEIIEFKKRGKDTMLQESEIDQITYQLYNLTPDEIALVEESIK